MQGFAPVLAVTAIFLCLTGSGFAEAPHGIPLKPDPPIVVDGDLGDWANVPNAFEID